MAILNNNVKALQPFNHFDDSISYFENVRGVTPLTITLKNWLEECTNPSGIYINYKNQIEEIRRTGNKDLKLTLPAISPGVVMSTRLKNVNEKIKTITGWMQFDIDVSDNPLMKDAAQVRDEVKKIVYVAFCSLSASGKGVWGLIKIKNIEAYKEHFEQLKVDFASRRIKLDASKGGNPTDLRLYSYDPNAYIATSFRIYDRKFKLNTPSRIRKLSRNNVEDSTISQVHKLIQEILHKRIDIAPDYKTYLNIGFAFSNEFEEDGRDLFHSVCSPSPKYKECDSDKQYTNCLKNTRSGITIATFFYLCQQSGIVLGPKKKMIVPKSQCIEVKEQTLIRTEHPKKQIDHSYNNVSNDLGNNYSTIIKDQMRTAFVDTTGNLYIQIPFSMNFAKYPSIAHYNDRLCLPECIDNLDINSKDLRSVNIDLNTLLVL